MATSITTLQKLSRSNLVVKMNKLGFDVSEDKTREEIIAAIMAAQSLAFNSEPVVEAEVATEVDTEVTYTELPDMSYGGPNGIEELEVSSNEQFMQASAELERLEDNVKAANIEYKPIVFPMTWLGGPDFQDAAGTEFRFRRLGFEYFRYHDRKGISHAQITQLIADGNMQAFADFTTNAMRFGGKFTAAIYQGTVVGFMKNYKPVDTLDLIENIRKANLGGHVTRTSIDQVKAAIDIKVASATTTSGMDVLAAIRVVNGHSGHVAMGYQTVLSVGGFELTRRYDSRVRRHLSQVSHVVDGLKDAMDETTDAKLLDRLQAMSFSDALVAITSVITQTEKQANLLGAAVAKHMDGQIVNGLDLFTEISQWVNVHGYRHAVSTLLQPLADKVLLSK